MSGLDRPRRALVTGGAGFIGSHLVRRLLREGCAVRVLDDLSSGFEANLAPVRGEIEFLRADVRDAAAVDRALAGVDVVFHEAAIASVPRSVADPVTTNAVNLDGTLALLESARRAGVRRVVFASSSAVYGDDPQMPKAESLPVCPQSPYALQKYVGECYCRMYAELYGLETVSLRYFNVYGPRQDPKSDYAAVVPLFVSAALAGRPVRIFGDGEQTRDFVHVSDVVEANWLAATRPGVSGEVFNVASGRTTSVNDLVRCVAACAGVEIETIEEAPREGDVRHSWADVTRIGHRLGYRAGTTLDAGLRSTIEGYRGGDGRRREVA